MNVLIAGATGTIGTALCRKLLDAGHNVTALSRNMESAAEKLPRGVRALEWDTSQEPVWADSCSDTGAVINLAGEPIAGGRWTPQRKERIKNSRVNATRRIVGAINSGRITPGVLVNASAIGYYGSHPDRTFTEDDPPGSGFLPEVCTAWEAEADRLDAPGTRLAVIRIGVVLDTGGGVLKQMLPVFRLGMGGRLGTGRQWMSWIHINDLADIIIHTVNTPSAGKVNAVSPNPVTNAEFTKSLAKILKRPALFPVPSFVIRLIFGEMGGLLLDSQKVAPAKLTESGFTFTFTEISAALQNLLG